MKIQTILENVKSVWGAGAAAVVAGPLGVWAGEIDPPDPAGLAVTIAIPFCVVSLLLAWLWGPVLLQKTRRVVATLLLLLGMPVLVLYLMTYFNTVISQPVPTQDGMQIVRVMIGTELRSHIEPGNRNEHELLMDYSFDPATIWTRASIRNNKTRLNGLFILSFVFLTAGVGLISLKTEGPDSTKELARQDD